MPSTIAKEYYRDPHIPTLKRMGFKFLTEENYVIPTYTITHDKYPLFLLKTNDLDRHLPALLSLIVTAALNDIF